LYPQPCFNGQKRAFWALYRRKTRLFNGNRVKRPIK